MLEEIMEIDIDLIQPNSYNPNKVPEEKLLVLSVSMEKDGQQHPIIVRHKDNMFEIVDGENRFNTAKKLGWKKIKVIKKEMTDEEAMRICYQVNVGRGEMDLFKEAEFFTTLFDKIGADEMEKQFGFTEQFIKNRKKLTTINIEQKEMLTKKIGKDTTLTGNHWMEFAKLDNDAKIKMAKSIRKDSHYSVSDFRGLSRRAKEEIAEEKQFQKVLSKAAIKVCPTCKGKAVRLDWNGKDLKCGSYHAWDPTNGIKKQAIIGDKYTKVKKVRSIYPRTINTTIDLDEAVVKTQELVLNKLDTISNITFKDANKKEWTVNFPINSDRLKIMNDDGYFVIRKDDDKVKAEVPGELTKKNYELTLDIIKILGGEMIERKKKSKVVATKK